MTTNNETHEQDWASEQATDVLSKLSDIDEAAGELMIDCPTCKGSGIGKVGPNPDWCEECGGPGQVYDFETDRQRRVGVVAAALRAAGQRREDELTMRGAVAADKLAAEIVHIFAKYDIPNLPEKETEIAALLAIAGDWRAVGQREEWQPIESAPKKQHTKILAVVPNGHICSAMWLDGTSGGDWWCALSIVRPTHWMPLPPPPGEHQAPQRDCPACGEIRGALEACEQFLHHSENQRPLISGQWDKSSLRYERLVGLRKQARAALAAHAKTSEGEGEK